MIRISNQFSSLKSEVIDCLKTIIINGKNAEDEDAIEAFLLQTLRPIAHEYGKSIQRHPKDEHERKIIPDLSIGNSEILIEVKKLEDKKMEGIYRLFYQVVKYRKMSKKLLILFVCEAGGKLAKEDFNDLKSLEIPPAEIFIISRQLSR